MDDMLSFAECSQCGNSIFVRDIESGEEICGVCGLVVSNNIVNLGPEWRAFTEAEKNKRSRIGMATSFKLYDKGLSTGFNWTLDARGKRLDHVAVNKMSRLRRHDNRSKLDDTWARNLSIAMAELERLTANLHVPQIVQELAALTYRKALKHDLIRGRSIDAFVAASLYAACRIQKVPRTLKKISENSSRDRSEIFHSYKLLLQDLGLKMPIDDPMKFVPRIAARLRLKRETERRAIDILRRVKEGNGLSGKDPRGIAAAALYKACKENGDKRLQKAVAAAAETTEVTLRNRLRGLEDTLSYLRRKGRPDP